MRPFRWDSDIDGELLDMVFDKKRAADRREWILDTFDESACVEVDPNEGNSLTYEDFINKEMIHFSHADNIRSIPSVIDGLKPSQRKVLYACFKRKLTAEIKVAQLTGFCAEVTAYHHGESSLQSTSKSGWDFVDIVTFKVLTLTLLCVQSLAWLRTSSAQTTLIFLCHRASSGRDLPEEPMRPHQGTSLRNCLR
jgi:hypothetical protein